MEKEDKNKLFNDSIHNRDNFDKTIFWINTFIITLTFSILCNKNYIINSNLYIIPNILSIISLIFNSLSDYCSYLKNNKLSKFNDIGEQYYRLDERYNTYIYIVNYIYVISFIISFVFSILLTYIKIFNN